MIDISTGKQMVGDGRIGDILSSGIAPAIVRGDAALQRNVGARQAAMCGGGNPYDEELEYLESNGNQYIALGGNYIGYGHTLEQYIDIQLLSHNRNVSIASAINNTLYIGPSSADGSESYWGANYTDETRRFVIDYSNFQHFYHKSLGLATRTWTLGTERFNGYLFSNGTSYLNGAIALFSTGNGGQTYNNNYAICRVRRYMFWYDEIIVHNLTPVLKNSIPCMFDDVGNVFYYNSTSGHQFGYKKKNGTIVAPY